MFGIVRPLDETLSESWRKKLYDYRNGRECSEHGRDRYLSHAFCEKSCKPSLKSFHVVRLLQRGSHANAQTELWALRVLASLRTELPD